MEIVTKLKEAATEFRQAIERVCASKCFKDDRTFFDIFPTGCCGEASDLLGHFLLLNGICSKRVCGYYYYGNPRCYSQSHAWLSIEGTIIDITGDQFKNRQEFLYYDKPVYVGVMDDFHSLFLVNEQIDVRESILLNELNGWGIEQSLKRYEVIVSNLPKRSAWF